MSEIEYLHTAEEGGLIILEPEVICEIVIYTYIFYMAYILHYNINLI